MDFKRKFKFICFFVIVGIIFGILGSIIFILVNLFLGDIFNSENKWLFNSIWSGISGFSVVMLYEKYFKKEKVKNEP
ncbi:hypothetical protein [Phocoenobacter atlanticus]|uniref:hypothetical protein n=1 Tax=Phocoenobacter atlanticus TaxID=3416742 RepID=UPI0027488056|nr:hypothetical protein [Pasteurella atlantica]MDP8101567.1 hypothetical protein [Pasteurella atlantica]